MRPLKIEALMDQEVQNLSGGELQRVAMTLCLGKPADVYLIDEPSAYLDSEQRLAAAKAALERSAKYSPICVKARWLSMLSVFATTLPHSSSLVTRARPRRWATSVTSR